MGKQSFDFSGLGRGAAVRFRRMIFVAAALAVLAAGSAAGAEGLGAPVAASSPQPLDPDFMLLPAHDLEYAVAPPSSVRVGDRLSIRVLGMKAAPGFSIALPPGSSPLMDQGWQILHAAAEASADVVFTAVPLRPGQLVLPMLAIRSGEGPEAKALARTNPLRLDVKSAIAADDPKPEQPADLRPPVRLTFPWWIVVVGGLVFLAIAALGGWLLYRWARRRRPYVLPAVPAAPLKPEDEEALLALAELESQAWMKKGQYKKHYFTASDVLKRYLGRRYDFDALESTALEIIAFLEDRRGASDRNIDRIESLFDRLDRVKFTDHVPESEDGRLVIEDLRTLVAETKRVPLQAVAPDAV